VTDTASRPRIAVFAGPNATVLNSEPLITSNKARERAGLPARTSSDGRPLRFDALRPQRLAAPATVYVEQFSAHPLEEDSAELYGPPDGYLDAAGTFHKDRSSADDTAVYEVTLRPEDGLYPLPYMALQADGRPWEGDEADPFGPPDRARQPFYPDASRVFEEIDRLHPADDGLASHLDRLADFDFFRPAPPGGYTKRGERRGVDYFPYRPYHLIRQPSRRGLARLTNAVSDALASGRYRGGLWLEGSPYVEETSWWLNLLIDTEAPIAACASQRAHGAVGNDGDRNIIDAVNYLTSGQWADAEGRDALGAVVVMDQLVVGSRAIQKAEARPGGYVHTGAHGAVYGSVTSTGRVLVTLRPVRRHTWSSEVRLSVLPERVEGVRRTAAGAERVEVPIRETDGRLQRDAIPPVWIFKHGQYGEPTEEVDPSTEVALSALLERASRDHPLAGLVSEGGAPYGAVGEAADRLLMRFGFSGFPVVRVGRGNAGGFAEPRYGPFAIAGGDHTATKARLLLMASLMRFGALPAAADPDQPTGDERAAMRAALDRYQDVFDSH
jgi:L-asparaginase/Glu-tRNA(Gln) amidotransferase subunit D